MSPLAIKVPLSILRAFFPLWQSLQVSHSELEAKKKKKLVTVAGIGLWAGFLHPNRSLEVLGYLISSLELDNRVPSYR